MIIHTQKQFKPTFLERLTNAITRFWISASIDRRNMKIGKLVRKINEINCDINDLTFYRDDLASRLSRQKMMLSNLSSKEGCHV